MSVKSKAIVGLILASLFWSAAGVVTKLLYRSLDPFPVAFLRFLLAFVVVSPLFLYQKNKPKLKHLVRLFPLAIMSTGNIFFYYLGLAQTTVIAAVLIYTTTPFVVAILGKLFIQEKLTLKKTLGITIGFIGVLVISVYPLLRVGQTQIGGLVGNLLVFAAVLCWSGYTISSRYLLRDGKYTPITLSSVTIFVSMLIFGLLTLIIPHRDIGEGLSSTSNLLLIGYLSVFMTVGVFLLYQWVIKNSSAVIASLHTYIQPVFGVILAMLILAESFTTEYLFGSMLIAVGLIIVSNIKVWNTKIK